MLRELLRDESISRARVNAEDDGGATNSGNAGGGDPDGFVVHTKAEEMEENLRM